MKIDGLHLFLTMHCPLAIISGTVTLEYQIMSYILIPREG